MGRPLADDRTATATARGLYSMAQQLASTRCRPPTWRAIRQSWTWRRLTSMRSSKCGPGRSRVDSSTRRPTPWCRPKAGGADQGARRHHVDARVTGERRHRPVGTWTAGHAGAAVQRDSDRRHRVPDAVGQAGAVGGRGAPAGTGRRRYCPADLAGQDNHVVSVLGDEFTARSTERSHGESMQARLGLPCWASRRLRWQLTARQLTPELRPGTPRGEAEASTAAVTDRPNGTSRLESSPQQGAQVGSPSARAVPQTPAT